MGRGLGVCAFLQFASAAAAFLKQRGHLDRRGPTSSLCPEAVLPLGSLAVGACVGIPSQEAQVRHAGDPKALLDVAAGRASLPASQAETAALPPF